MVCIFLQFDQPNLKHDSILSANNKCSTLNIVMILVEYVLSVVKFSLLFEMHFTMSKEESVSIHVDILFCMSLAHFPTKTVSGRN